MKKIISFIIYTCFVSCFMFTGCEKDKDYGQITAITIKEAVYVQSINCMQISLKDNATIQLTPFILPQNASNQTVKYSNKYPELMSVSESGLITAKAVGTDTLTVCATDGSGVAVSYQILITDHKVKATAINVTAAGSNFELKIGGTPFNLASCITLSPTDTWDKTVTYKSNDETIATVSADGLVSPVAAGSTTITIRTADGSNISRDCNVTVKDKVQRWDDLSRIGWTVTTLTGTGYEYVPDGTTGLPAHILDNSGTTFLSLVKPGKSYTPVVAQPSNFLPSFTVDIKSKQKFNYIMWRHREGNSNHYLRVFGVNVYGSDDGSAFTKINTGGIVWIPNINGYLSNGGNTNDNNIYRNIDIPESEYRYVKIELAIWSDVYDSQHPDYQGKGTTSGSTMQVAEFGLGNTYWE